MSSSEPNGNKRRNKERGGTERGLMVDAQVPKLVLDQATFSSPFGRPAERGEALL